MSHRLARFVILAAALALTACVSPTGPAKSDCSGGVTGGSNNSNGGC
jgi:hypothetical protein